VSTLYAKSGPLAGKRIKLVAELVIGREGADVTIDDPQLSRRHVAIRVMEKGVEVEDLGSTNGTFVDDRRLEGPMRVGGGALIRLGATTFELQGVLRVKGSRQSHEIAKPEVTRLHSVPRAAVTRPHKIPEPESTNAGSVTPAGAGVNRPRTRRGEVTTVRNIPERAVTRTPSIREEVADPPTDPPA
jgi:pSer/pThr/pTyr-binding forkhead associated (FHA) protein